VRDFHKILFAAALFAAISFAQEQPVQPAPTAEAAAAAKPEPAPVAEPIPVAKPEPAPTAEPVPVAKPDSAVMAEPKPADTTALVAAEQPPAVQEPEPVVAEQPPVPETPPVAPVEPTAPVAPAPVAQPAAPAAPSEPIVFEAGLRLGLGASQFRNHIAIPASDNKYGIQLDPAFSFSLGAAFQIGFNKIFALAPELQYTLYRANGELVSEIRGSKAPRNLYQAGVYTQSLELPVLARLRFGTGYAELGPQVGLNLYSKMYSNADYWRPDMNLLAFGVAAGGGVNLGGILAGVRGYFGILEYAKDAKGIPWGVQLSITPLVF